MQGINHAVIGSVAELESPPFADLIELLDRFADKHSLRRTRFLSKAWEYPAVLNRLFLRFPWIRQRQGVSGGLKILDVGSELSPVPWVLALSNTVTLVELASGSIVEILPTWIRVAELIPGARWRAVADERLPFPDNEFDVVTSFSVIEHQPNKELAISEAIRVLKPGGILGISFDVFETETLTPGALTLEEFERLIWSRPEFGNTDKPKWNLEDLPGFIKWHRTRPAIRVLNNEAPDKPLFLDDANLAYGVGAALLVKGST